MENMPKYPRRFKTLKWPLRSLSWKVEDHKYRVGDLTTSGRNTGTVHDVPRKDQ